MREFRYNMAYVAMYSPRPGAASYRWPDDVPHEEKNRRLHAAERGARGDSRAWNQRMIGREYPVLVEGRDRKSGYLTAKTEGRITVRFASEDASLIGTFVRVRITSAAALSLEGELAAPKVETARGRSEASAPVAGSPRRRRGWTAAAGRISAR